MILTFDTIQINVTAFEILRDGELQDVEPRVFDLIAFFATNPGQVFSKEQLMHAVWDGRIVSDATIATGVKNARKALGDTGSTQRYLETVRGRGYRFNGEATQTSSALKSQDKTGDEASDPSIMILPLRCSSENLEIRRLATEISDHISRVMSRIPLLRFSSEANHYKDQLTPPTAKTVYRDFGVDFVLDGSMEESGTQARATIQLANARTGFRIWSESFQIEQPFYEQLDRLVELAIGKLEPQVHKAMYTHVRADSNTPTARSLFLEASGLLVMHGWSHSSFDAARSLLRKSADLDPDFALTHALQALICGFSARIGLSAQHEKTQAQARRSAELALELDSMDSTVVGLAACSLADIGDIERGEFLLRNAIDLNPSNAQAWVALGAVRLAQMDSKEAIDLLSKGIDISPHDSRLSIWGAFLSVAYLLNHELEQACSAAEVACQKHDKTYLPRIALAAARLAQGNIPASRKALHDARRIKPDLSFAQIAAVVGKELAAKITATDT